MFIIHIDHYEDGKEVLSIPTLRQSGVLTRAKEIAVEISKVLPFGMHVSVRHHRSKECFYQIRGTL